MQPACSLHAGRRSRCAGRRPRDAGRRTPCTRRRRRNVHVYFNGRRLHLKRNAGCMQGVDAKKIRRELNLQPACRLHACCCNLQPPAYDRMQAACRLHASLVWHWLNMSMFRIQFFTGFRIIPDSQNPVGIPDFWNSCCIPNSIDYFRQKVVLYSQSEYQRI